MTRTEVINGVIEKNSYTSYLEIGIYDGKNFDSIKCDQKQGVDPNVVKKGVAQVTSDEFFQTNEFKWDVIFIDGDHTYDQALKDFRNALDWVSPNGLILMHDTNPKNIKEVTPRNNGAAWCGEVWKVALEAKWDGYPLVTIPDDYGVTIIKPECLESKEDPKEISSAQFMVKKKELLNFMPWRDYMNITEEVKEIEKKGIKIELVNRRPEYSRVEGKIDRVEIHEDSELTLKEDTLEHLKSMSDEELKETHAEMFGSKPRGKFNRDKIIEKILN